MANKFGRKRRTVKASKRRVLATNNSNVSVSKIKKFIEDSVNNLQNTNYTNSRLILDNDLCLYVGYSDGFDTEDGYAICAKIAERNDGDWADFDYLNMPWNTYDDNDGSTGVFEGDVYDTNIEITPGEDYSQDAQWLADSYTEIRNLLDEGKLTIESSCSKKSVKAAESYGWVVNDHEAWDAYYFAIDSGWWDEAQLDNDIVHTLSSEELASSLAYIFRMNEFREWDERNDEDDEDDEDIEESVRAKRKRAVRASKLRRGKNRKAVTAAKLTVSFDEFKPWSGAVDTWETLEKYDKLDLLEQILDDTYYNESAGEGVINETELNDLLWFEPETVYEWVGLYYDPETDEVSDEPFEAGEEEDFYEDEEIEESIKCTASKPLSSSEKKKCIEQIAYDYGVSKKQATEWYNSYSDERRRAVLDGAEANAKKSFYND